MASHGFGDCLLAGNLVQRVAVNGSNVGCPWPQSVDLNTPTGHAGITPEINRRAHRLPQHIYDDWDRRSRHHSTGIERRKTLGLTLKCKGAAPDSPSMV